ncbi:DNA adenine methylase [Pelistega ratti]|uniref:DNA adenine methylase n=1 Tax=Pelistega ratti TaxID=2652177 RepID=UPI0013587C70|nr:DNA adenine methylase [Pelistega ratti]
MNTFYTPLRYPGGKGKFAPFIESLIKLNEYPYTHYLEVYAGGAAIALDLLYKGFIKEIHINDIDFAIYAFWYAAVYQTDEMIDKIRSVDISLDNWYYYKGILIDESNNNTLEKGFATFFMNRCNRSGILKGGMIGGRAQTGQWKLDARFNKEELIKRFELIKKYRSQIYVHNKDAKELLESCHDFLPVHQSLIYLDPPYFVKGQGLYRNFYQAKDHEEIKKTLDHLQYDWIVSYDNVPEIRKIYKGYSAREHILNYSAYEKKLGNEIIFFSPKLRIPRKNLRKAA